MIKNAEAMVGTKINHLEILDVYREGYKDKAGHNRTKLNYKCRCVCGNIKDVLVTQVKSGRVKSCGCFHKKTGKESLGWKGYEEISGAFWIYLKSYGEKHNEFTLTIQEAWDLFIKQDRKCAVTGKEIVLDHKLSKSIARVQRIDPTKSFCLENIRWVHKDVTGTARVSSNHRQWTGYEEIHGAFWASIKAGARHRKIDFDLTIQDAWNIFIKQNRKCALTNIELYFYVCFKHKKRNLIDGTASLDRIDSSKGYVLGNIQWVHKHINHMKMAYSQSDFIDWCHKVSDHQRSLEK